MDIYGLLQIIIMGLCLGVLTGIMPGFGILAAILLSFSWLKNFDAKYREIKNLGFSDEFIRKWRFYLCYCIAGFNSKRTDVVQFELVKIL